MSATVTVDERAVAAAGGRLLAPPPGGAALALGGWEVSVTSAPIAADARAEALKKALGLPAAPEQLYLDNALRLRHGATGAELRFCAADALAAWRPRGAGGDGAGGAECVAVPAAAAWRAARAAEVAAARAVPLRYDWTFSTPYRGSVARGAAGAGAGAGGAGAAGAAGQEEPGAAGPPPPPPPPPPRAPPPAWRPAAEGERLDRAALAARDPVLLYADVPLYASELDDCGAAALGVKVRVMPRRWYVLLRLFVRVDGVMVRLREARLACELGGGGGGGNGGGAVLRETRWAGGELAALAAAGAPGGAAAARAYADGDAAAAALMAAAPAGVTRFEVERLALV